MARRKRWISALLLVSVWSAPTLASGTVAVMETIAVRLNDTQIKEGELAGGWGEEWGFAGSIVAGMVEAYECTQNEVYGTSAWLGGMSIRKQAGNNFLGDEIYALVRLIAISGAGGGEQWQTIATTFFDGIFSRPEGVGGYTDLYLDVEPSTAVFYLAHFAVAAHDVNAVGADDWRQALLSHLTRVADGTSSYPVMALGVATWALARTGELDDTLVDSANLVPQWKDVRLRDLPMLLASHQVPEGEPLGGSFYWRFDHTGGPFRGPMTGFTEDTIYGALGLVAVASREENASNESLENAIRAVCVVLLDAVSADGTVYERLGHGGASYFAYAGEMLQALGAVNKYLDSRTVVPVGGADPNTAGEEQ